jgi:hypothetical protein
MSDMQYTTPPMPPTQPQKKDNKLQIIAAVFAGLAFLGVIFAITMPSGNEFTPTAATQAPQPVVTSPAINKYDAYYEHVLNNSGQANTAGKADVIEFGDLVCQSLDAGRSIAAITELVANASSSTSDMELGAAVIYGAVKHLCPEYDSMLRAYLNS